jgi:voltage-gated potassium channel
MTQPVFNGLVSLTASLRNFVLIAGLGGIIAITIPGFPLAEWRWVDAILWFCLGFYALEWALDVWGWTRVPSQRRPLLTADHVVDVVAVIPVLAGHFIGLPPSTVWLLGALWLLKLPAMTSGFSLLSRVLMLEAKPLASVVVVFMFVLFMSAVALYLIERDVQPTAFGTLPAALYWAVTTLTTTGYGDVVPMTPLGRMTAGIVMICGLAVFGLWTGILATGFAAETRRRDFVRTWEFVARVPFFRPLNPAAIIEIARMLRPLEVAERHVIIRKGRQGDCMYFIADGQVEIVGSNPLVKLGSGAFFGELALLGDGIRTATVVATVPTTLLVLELTDYRIFVAHYPDLAKAVEVEGARRLAERAGKGPQSEPALPEEAVSSSPEVAPTE